MLANHRQATTIARSGQAEICGEIVVLSPLASVNRPPRRPTCGVASVRRGNLGRARLFKVADEAGRFWLSARETAKTIRRAAGPIHIRLVE